MAEGTEAVARGDESRVATVNFTQENGVIKLLEMRLEDIQSRESFLMSDFAHQTIDPGEIRREHTKLHHERLGVESRLQMAREEAGKILRRQRDWTLGSRTKVGANTLDYVQFLDRRYEVILFAVNHQGDITRGRPYNMSSKRDMRAYIEGFIEMVQEDDNFHPVPATTHILSAIIEMGKSEKSDMAWKLEKVAEDMLEEINKTRPRSIIRGRLSSAS